MSKPPIKGIAKSAPDIAEVTCAPCGGSGVDPRSWADDALPRAYQRTNGEPGNPHAEVLLAEIGRRRLDV